MSRNDIQVSSTFIMVNTYMQNVDFLLINLDETSCYLRMCVLSVYFCAKNRIRKIKNYKLVAR